MPFSSNVFLEEFALTVSINGYVTAPSSTFTNNEPHFLPGFHKIIKIIFTTKTKIHSVTEILCLPQTFFVSHRQSVSVTDSLLLSHRAVPVTDNMCLYKTMIHTIYVSNRYVVVVIHSFVREI